ncbi:ABC-F family ATP-binding cassette domain-containing protein [uncultured Intestinibacter sp.]|uniref:ABC-F family ATP-binding cassette domain-containing protein n=1 Tax=uncultured Intestinibacter sp. TaxID=1505659 RepID=UPI0027DC1A36|nr:ABC-F family ATP-binding cassette domain-containing protein [uncultured Intestinibacter sp.]
MIKFDKVSYSFPQKDLYTDVSFTIEEGQHCAFIGASGSGKSTLIDIIMDPEKYVFDGNVEMEPSLKIGYVSQFSQRDKDKETTVFEYIAEEFIKLENEIATLCAEMGTSDDIETLLEKYQEALDAFDAIDGDNYENNINKKLNAANLTPHRDRMISELSGGEFKLIQVIKEMLNNPDLMIMDEPDVFLDFENLNSLKNLINSHKKTILVITHNRYLLNHCFNKIIHLENTELQEFDGRYIDYNFSLLQTKIELQEMAIADEEEIARNEELIKILREKATYNADASRGRALKARVKIQERLEANRIKHPFVDIKQPYINLETNNEIEEEIIALKTDNLGISFDEVLLQNVNFEIKSNDKVAIIGTNGVGKTTLLKQIFKNNNDAIKIDENIKLAYLSQMQSEVVNESNTILQEFYDVGFETYGEIRRYLGRYGFSSDILTQKIESLSGGEKNILQLAKVSASKANMLLMDEPTSHLDIYSQMALEKAISNYKGAILMISHDYHFIVNCADYVLLIGLTMMISFLENNSHRIDDDDYYRN